jgi:hypothetical protein
MKKQLFFTLIAMILGLAAKSQGSAAVPNYLLAGQISVLVTKLGLPVDSVGNYLTALGQYRQTQETAADVFYESTDNKVVFDLKKNASGQIQIIICDMPDSMLSTAQKAINLMGMIATGTAAPPGFTAYATPKYAAFLNPEQREGFLGLVLVPGQQ